MRLHRHATLRTFGLVGASLLVLAAAGPASAQVDEGFNAQNFQPPIDPHGYITLNGARTLRQWQPFFAVYGDAAKDPLDLRRIREGFIDEMAFAHAVFGLGVLDIGEHGGLSFGLVVPYVLHMEGMSRDPGTGDPASAPGDPIPLPDEEGQEEAQSVKDPKQLEKRLGDVRVESKIVLLDRDLDPLGVAFRAWFTFPTGEDLFFTSNDERIGAGGAVILEKQIGDFRMGVEAGYEWLEGDVVLSRIEIQPGKLLEIDDKLHLRAGVAQEIFVDHLWLVAEAHHWTRFENPYDKEAESPVELGGALRYDNKVLLLLGGSAGLTDGVGAPTARGFAAVGFAF